VGRRVETGIADRRVEAGEDDDRPRFGIFEGVLTLKFMISVGLESGDNRRRYLRTGSFDFFVGDSDESGVLESSAVFEGVVGPVLGVACAANVVS